VGLPNETDFDFKETMKSIRNAGFSHIHTFKYSVRTGTVAGRMENQVSENIKNKRSALIRKLSDENKLEYYGRFINKVQKVLVEKELDDGRYFGYGENYLPIIFKHHQNLINEFVTVKITGLENGDKLLLQGELIEHMFVRNPQSESVLAI
jgi:threonylcarbamoyladenosine tRNA methylthiotransferase MtaB